MKSQPLTPRWITLCSAWVVLIFFAGFSGPAEANCQINVFVKNAGNARLRVHNSTDFTGVKSKGGMWRGLNKGHWFIGEDTIILDPRKTKGTKYFAKFRCGAKRRYRISYYCQAGVNNRKSFSDYYPSSTGWTTNQTVTISLRHCK